MKMGVLVFALFFLGSCNKQGDKNNDPHKPPDNDDPFPLELVWKMEVSSKTIGSQSRQPMVYQDKLLWNNARPSEGFKVFLSDGRTGDTIWLWDDFIKAPLIHWNNHQFIAANTYFMSGGEDTYAIDMIGGQTKWQDYSESGGPNIENIGGFLYGKIFDKSFKPNVCTLRRTRYDQLSWEPILTLHKDSLNGYCPYIFGPDLWMSPQGDSILVFQNRSWNFDSIDGQIDLYAYNLSDKEIQFIIRDIEPTGNSNVLSPMVDGDRVYLLGNRNLHCVDLVSESILWQKGFPGSGHHLMLSNLVVDGNILVVKPDNDAIYGLDKYTGDVIWHQFDAGESPSHMQLYRGAVYYTAEGTGKLYAVSTVNGDMLIATDSPYDNSSHQSSGFDSGVAINPDLEYLYAHDGHYMMCFKL